MAAEWMSRVDVDSAAAAAALAAEEQLRASGRQIKRVTKDLPEYQPQHKSKPKGRLSESLQVSKFMRILKVYDQLCLTMQAITFPR